MGTNLRPEEIAAVKAMNPHPIRDQLLRLLELLANTLPDKQDYDFIMSSRDLETKEVDVTLPKIVWELLDKYGEELGNDAIRDSIGEAIMMYLKATDKQSVLVGIAFMDMKRKAANGGE